MPYYLVMQTSLVEASDPLAAAEQALAKLEHAQEVAFMVKLDENHITPVTVQRKELSNDPDAHHVVADDIASPGDAGCDERMQATELPRVTDLAARRFVISFALFLSGALVGLAGYKLML